ncbi:threonine aldolase family protein [Rhizorhabdus histidinilytica]
MRERHDFFSDNTAGICPEALAAFAAANAGFVPSYGADRLTAQAADAVRALLDADAEVRFVSTGTVANAIACATLCPSAGAVLAYEQAHILIHEAGAPSFFGGGLEIEPLAGIDSRIEPAALDHALARPRGPHERRPAALSLTNATEYGTVYDEAMLARLCGPAKDAGLGIHLDGARLANAVAAGFDPRALTRAGIDIVVLGGSKAGPFLRGDRAARHQPGQGLRRAAEAERPAHLEDAAARGAVDRPARRRGRRLPVDRPCPPRQCDGAAAGRRPPVRARLSGRIERGVRDDGRRAGKRAGGAGLALRPVRGPIGPLRLFLGDEQGSGRRADRGRQGYRLGRPIPAAVPRASGGGPP